jgi:pimeloyl-ACP methyl ester carboxylesterase
MPLLIKDYEVIAVDLMGCGDSDILDDYTIESQAEFVLALCRQLKLVHPLVVGVSLGGYVGLMMAQIRPKEILGVVPVGVVFREGTNRLTHGMMRGVLRLNQKSSRLTQWSKRVVNNKWFVKWAAEHLQLSEYDQAMVEDLRHGRETIDPKGVVDMGIESTSVKVVDLLKKAKVPVLVVQGEKDKFEKISRVERIVNSLGDNVSLKRVADCGHTVQLEKPVELVRLLEEFEGSLG